MACLAANRDLVVVARDNLVDLYNVNSDAHSILRMPSEPASAAESDGVVDVAISPDGVYVAVMTGTSKRLVVFELNRPDAPTLFSLPRAATRARFTADSTQILVADKTGDALFFDLKEPSTPGVKLFGHLSILLDILMSDDGNYIITSDRDEKIRVSHYPNTYNIKAYCLGHKEFVKQVQLLPHDTKFLLSASGDGSIKIWDYADGRLCHTIETKEHIENNQFLESFVEVMDKEGVEVNALPVVHMSVMQIGPDVSLIAVTVYTIHKVFIYRIKTKSQHFEHTLYWSVSLEKFPYGLQLSNGKLFVCLDGEEQDCIVQVYQVNEPDGSVKILKTSRMFAGEVLKGTSRPSDIKVLYKRKFDNVQEYQDRKRQRLEQRGES